jgi:hypothetical protein
MSNSNPFTGAWLVSEYVYTPVGELVGVVRQQRKLNLHDDVVCVVQMCAPIEPAAHLTGEAERVAQVMNQRVGKFVFDLKLVGRARHYLGEDVLGGGFSWRDGVLTARGVWTRFGFNFTSFSILIKKDLQVTGGKFFIANREICTIVGLATPEDQGYPAFGAPPTAVAQSELSADCGGVLHSIAPDGTALCEKQIDANVLNELDLARFLHAEKPGFVRGRMQRYGALCEVEAATAPGKCVSWLDIDDGWVRAGLRKWFVDEKLSKVEVYTLAEAHK